ncbi:MAG: hypothetical protein WBD99_12255 [Thermodesulfobacteriota bacterium]
MAIPYDIKRMLPERVGVKSELLCYVPVSEDTITEYILENYNVGEARANKTTGTLTIIEFNPEPFDPSELFKALENASPDQILKPLTTLQKRRRGKK